MGIIVRESDDGFGFILRGEVNEIGYVHDHAIDPEGVR